MPDDPETGWVTVWSSNVPAFRRHKRIDTLIAQAVLSDTGSLQGARHTRALAEGEKPLPLEAIYQRTSISASMITSKAANCYHFKNGRGKVQEHSGSQLCMRLLRLSG
jgi:hypothetical protein